MKVKVTITGYYDIPDDPKERFNRYATTDLAECIDTDRKSAAEDLDLLMEGLEDLSAKFEDPYNG